MASTMLNHLRSSPSSSSSFSSASSSLTNSLEPWNACAASKQRSKMNQTKSSPFPLSLMYGKRTDHRESFDQKDVREPLKVVASMVSPSSSPSSPSSSPSPSSSSLSSSSSPSSISVNTQVQGRSDWNHAQEVVEELKRETGTPVERLNLIINTMVERMCAGLAMEGGSRDYKMIVTYVDELPSGKERGNFYALDLGGTNFRVLRLHVKGKSPEPEDRQMEEATIPSEIKSGTHEELFDFLAQKLASFVANESSDFAPLPGQKRELGFTFSFPINQTSVASGKLIKWTKGFHIEGTAGKDVVEALNEAMARQGLDMIVSALINDTVGTLAVASMGASEDEEVLISIILGTGTNACYVENIDAIPKWKGPKPSSGKMIINTEWGGLNSPFLPWTQYDDALDIASVNPGEQIYEKLLSGMYLGDVVRRVLLRVAEETALFGKTVPPKLRHPFILGTPSVATMHQDASPDLQEVQKILSNVLGIEATSLNSRKLVVEICGIVVRRASRLAGAGIVALLKKMGKDVEHGDANDSNTKKIVVAMDGGLYEHYPFFREELKAAVIELLGEKAAERVKIVLSKDGSGIGAALLAAAHSQYKSKEEEKNQ